MCHLTPGDAFLFSVLLSSFKHPLAWGVEKNPKPSLETFLLGYKIFFVFPQMAVRMLLPHVSFGFCVSGTDLPALLCTD